MNNKILVPNEHNSNIYNINNYVETYYEKDITENNIMDTDNINSKNENNVVKGSNEKHIKGNNGNSKNEYDFVKVYTYNGTL